MAMETSVDIKSAKEVLAVEQQRIKARRRIAGLPEGNPAEDSVGLALSGCGIRSATFNLGLLQAMNYYKFFPKVDYLSTVSGGGYIGSSLTWFMSRLGKPFPFVTTCKDIAAARMLNWLRCHSSYLIPGQGLGLAALAAAVLRGMFINRFSCLCLSLLSMVCRPRSNPIPKFPGLRPGRARTPFPLLFAVGAGLTIGLLGWFIIYALLSVGIRQQDFNGRRMTYVWIGRMLTIAVALMVIGLTPKVYEWLRLAFDKWWDGALSSFSIGGIISFLVGWMGRTRNNETQGWVAWLFRIGLVINTNMVTVGSQEAKARGRGGDYFIFSPEFVGSEATGYMRTKRTSISGERTWPRPWPFPGPP